MLTCPNCHAELEEGSLYCDSCGAKVENLNSLIEYCPHCGKQVNIEFDFCQYCGKSILQKPEKHPKKSGLKKGLLFGGIGAGVIIAASFLVFFLFTGNGNSHQETKNEHPETDYALYLKDYELFFTDLSKDSWQLTSRLIDDIDKLDHDYLYRTSFNNYLAFHSYYQPTDGLLQISKDGNTIFFPDKINCGYDGSFAINEDPEYDNFSLYYKNIKKPDNDAIKIASDVTSYQLDKNTTIVTYSKNNNLSLHQYDIKKGIDQKIENNVYTYYVSDDGKKILYMTGNFDLYLVYPEKNKEKIAGDISDITYVKDDLSTVYYFKDDILYKKEEGKDKVRISSDIDTILSIYESGEVYYVKKSMETVPLMDYVKDDIILADASESIPVHSETSVKPAVSSVKIPDTKASVTSFFWMDRYNSYYGQAVYPTEAAPAEEEAEEAAPAFYEEYDLPSRQKLLEDLKNYKITLYYYTLCYYNGEEEITISDHVTTLSENYASNFPAIAFKAYDPSKFEKIKLSELSGTSDITSIYNYAFRSNNHYVEGFNEWVDPLSTDIQKALNRSAKDYIAINDNITEINRDTEYITPFIFSQNGKTIFYMDNVTEKRMEGDLYKITISGKELKKPELYDQDVYAFSMQFITDDKFLYFKEYDNYAGDLYINKTRIDSDVAGDMLCYNEAADSLSYLTDLNINKSTFTLNIFQNGETEKIADDVYSFAPLSKKGMLYISDYNKEYLYGDLYLYKNKKDRSTLIDDDVTDIVQFYHIDRTFFENDDIVYIY